MAWGTSSPAWGVFYLGAVSADEECLLTGSARTSSLLSCPVMVSVPEEEEGQYTTLSLVLRGEEGSGEPSWPLADLLGHPPPIRRDGTSGSAGVWVGAMPQPAGEHGPVASGCWGAGSGFLFRGATFIESRPFLRSRLSTAASSPLHPQPILHPLPQTNARIS